jgi:ADP-ribose pyrophosphatase YjhB (NUDIX family)
MSDAPRWLQWCARLQAIAQTGLTFSRDPYDSERYTAIREIAAEMLAAGSGAEMSVIRDLVSADCGYATPKVDVRGVVFREGRLLLVREKSEGAWSLPGGWADVPLSPAENAAKEVFEESGFRVRPKKILAVFDRDKHPHQPPIPFHVYKLFILCELIGGTETLSNETDAVGFFAADDLPPLSLTRNTPWQIQRMFEHCQHPDWPADFDEK